MSDNATEPTTKLPEAHPDKVICPNCVHQFYAIPVSTQMDLYYAQQMVLRYRSGNTELLELMMKMCAGETTKPLERARDILLSTGLMRADGTLDWDALEERKPKPQTWAEAVRSSVKDPAEQARLIALGDVAAADE